MHRFSLFVRLLKADFKRIIKYFPSLLLSVCILFAVCASFGYSISGHIYKENTYTATQIAYYLPEGEDSYMTQLFIDILNTMDSIEEATYIFPVSSEDEALQMLDRGEILFFIRIPDDFFTGLTDGANTPLEFVMRDISDVSAYITNELLMSYAAYLTIADSASYSAHDAMWDNDYSWEEISTVNRNLNLTFTAHAMDKDEYMQTVDATGESGGTLLQHYLSSAVMLVLFLLAVILMPFIQGRSEGVVRLLKIRKLNNFHIFLSNFICTIPALYLAFLPCFIGIGIYNHALHPSGLVTVLPVVCGIALLINLAGAASRHMFTGNMLVFGMALILAYIGGGIIPHALLPSVVQTVSHGLPGEYFISGLRLSLFGV